MSAWNETTVERTSNAKRFLIGMLFLATISLLTWMWLFPKKPQPINHSNERHGTLTMSRVEHCIQNNRTVFEVRNPKTDRKLIACYDETGNWLLKIEECKTTECVTMFAKEKMKTVKQILRYAANKGYTVPLFSLQDLINKAQEFGVELGI